MAIYERAYRPFEGTKHGRGYRLLAVAYEAIRVQRPRGLKSWLFWGAFLLFGGSIFFFFASVFFAIGYFQDPSWESTAREILAFLGPELLEAYYKNPEELRAFLWSYLFCLYSAEVLIFLTIFAFLALIPNLISRELKHNGLLVYFSRPIGLFEYIGGKALSLLLFFFFFTVLPVTVLYGLSLAFSRSATEVLAQTFPIYLKTLLALSLFALVLIPLALYISSLSKYRRIVLLFWILLWMGSGMAPYFLKRQPKEVARGKISFPLDLQQKRHDQKKQLERMFSHLKPPLKIAQWIPLSQSWALLEDTSRGVLELRILQIKAEILSEGKVLSQWQPFPETLEELDQRSIPWELWMQVHTVFSDTPKTEIQVEVLQKGKRWLLKGSEEKTVTIRLLPRQAVLEQRSTLTHLLSPIHNLQAVYQKIFGLMEQLDRPFVGRTLRVQIAQTYLYTHPWTWSLGILCLLSLLSFWGLASQLKKYM